jgi:uncharacterized repeat protein (TIGR01451 family)
MIRRLLCRGTLVALAVLAVAVPTALAAGDGVQVEKMSPPRVTLGHEYTYTIKVTNVSDATALDVKVVDKLPDSFTFKSASPDAKPAKDKTLTWSLGDLAAGASKTLTVTGVAAAPGTNKHCGTMAYAKQYCVATLVVEPKLELAKTAPAEVIICQSIPVRLTVKNPGTGTATNVKVVDKLPEGLTTQDGKDTLTFEVGNLEPGATREFSANLKAAKTGKYENTAVATADDKLKAEAKATTVVRQPILKIAKTGPAQVFLGRNATYTMKVENTGDAVAANTVVKDTLPAGTTLVSASDGGMQAGNQVTWTLGDLKPKEAKTLTLVLKSATAQTLTNTAQATAQCADAVTATAKTVYKGIPAILLEMVDLVDPVEIGDTTTYVITATNQGSAPGTQIKIVCTLEETQEFVSADGKTQGAHKERVVTFEPLPNLAPGDKAVWRVVVKAVKASDARFKVQMTSDQLTRPVEANESTTLY